METKIRKIVAREVWDGNSENTPVPLEIMTDARMKESYVVGYELAINRAGKGINNREVQRYSVSLGLDPQYALQGMNAAIGDYNLNIQRYAPKKENFGQESSMRGIPRDLNLIMDGMERNPGFIPNEFWDLESERVSNTFRGGCGTPDKSVLHII